MANGPEKQPIGIDPIEGDPEKPELIVIDPIEGKPEFIVIDPVEDEPEEIEEGQMETVIEWQFKGTSVENGYLFEDAEGNLHVANNLEDYMALVKAVLERLAEDEGEEIIEG